MKNTIDQCEFTELISYAFYINKLNLVGIVYDGRSQIIFYDGSNFKKTGIVIDIKDTQDKIDKLEIKMLDKKAEELFLKNEEEKKLKNQINNDLLKKKGRRQSSILQNIQQLNKKAKDVNDIGKKLYG